MRRSRLSYDCIRRVRVRRRRIHPPYLARGIDADLGVPMGHMGSWAHVGQWRSMTTLGSSGPFGIMGPCWPMEVDVDLGVPWAIWDHGPMYGLRKGVDDAFRLVAFAFAGTSTGSHFAGTAKEFAR
jgi:hypothetical protein